MERDALGCQAAARLGPCDIIVWKKTLSCTKSPDRPLRDVDFYEEEDEGDGGGTGGRGASAFRATKVSDLEAAKMFSRHPWKHQVPQCPSFLALEQQQLEEKAGCCEVLSIGF